jgi:hypothetical protein
MKRLEQGYHDGIPIADYIADPCPEPSASTGVILDMLNRSAKHAHLNHPRLGGALDSSSSRGDVGSAVHSLAFGGPPIEYVGEVVRKSGKDKTPFVPTDWKTTDAQEQRDAIRARGAIPLLECDRVHVEAAAASAKATLAELGDLGAMKLEQTMVWFDEEFGVWCRCRPDALPAAQQWDIDLKTCENADPASWIKSTLYSGGYDVQGMLRARGHDALTGRTRDPLYLLVEIAPPYASSLVALSPEAAEYGRMKVEAGLSLFAKRLKANEWPGYDKRIHYAEVPAYVRHDVAARLGVSL